MSKVRTSESHLRDKIRVFGPKLDWHSEIFRIMYLPGTLHGNRWLQLAEQPRFRQGHQNNQHQNQQRKHVYDYAQY